MASYFHQQRPSTLVLRIFTLLALSLEGSFEGRDALPARAEMLFAATFRLSTFDFQLNSPVPIRTDTQLSRRKQTIYQ
jgi:hypothetical protein